MDEQDGCVDVRLMGGLGNQLFQFAFGEFMARKHGVCVAYDHINGFLGDRFARQFRLPLVVGEVPLSRGSTIPWDARLGIRWCRLLKLWRGLQPLHRRRIIFEERPFYFDLSAGAKPLQRAYYYGYWQHHGYAAEVRQEILARLRSIKELSGNARNLAAEIASFRSIAVHVRRYADRTKTGQLITSAAAFHGTCSASYYYQGLRSLPKESNQRVFVFSDEIEWAKENIKVSNDIVFIDKACCLTDVEELLLMSQCAHHVISNSTFGWWGAWLGTASGQVVIAPGHWIVGARAEGSICPPNWMLLKNER
jgi:hypothetical protein